MQHLIRPRVRSHLIGFSGLSDEHRSTADSIGCPALYGMRSACTLLHPQNTLRSSPFLTLGPYPVILYKESMRDVDFTLLARAARVCFHCRPRGLY